MTRLHFFPMVTVAGAAACRPTMACSCVNHEYTDDGLLHPDGMKTWTAAKVRKSQAAHGVSVIEVRAKAQVDRRSPVHVRAPHHGVDADDSRAVRRLATRRCARRTMRPDA